MDISRIFVQLYYKVPVINETRVALLKNWQSLNYIISIDNNSVITQDIILPIIKAGLNAGEGTRSLRLSVEAKEIGVMETVKPKHEKKLWVDITFDSLESTDTFLKAVQLNNKIEYSFLFQGEKYSILQCFTSSSELLGVMDKNQSQSKQSIDTTGLLSVAKGFLNNALSS